MMEAQVAWLPDGRRLHLQHGPIDLIVDANGMARDAALAAAVDRFAPLLSSLVAELTALRRPLEPGHAFAEPVARRMASAVSGFPGIFVTPMAAVAGAVADEVLHAMRSAGPLTRAYVNNGGDIAIYLADGQSFDAAGPTGPIRLEAAGGAGGLATSGWGGRSHSLGIADAVTVVAASAAAADVAATLIANAVDLPGHPGIDRLPACELDPDSDLGARLVTTSVAPLSPADRAAALARGASLAESFRARGVLLQASLTLQGSHRLVTSNHHPSPGALTNA